MNTRDLTSTPAMRAALGVLAVAVLATGWTLVRAFRTPTLADSPVTTIASLETIARAPARAPAKISTTVENDLFSSDRSAPAAPYRMPGENEPSEKPVIELVKPTVLGTVVATDGRSFATVKLGDGTPTLVHVGGKIGEWVVKGIERGKISLVSSGGTRIDVTVPKPGT